MRKTMLAGTALAAVIACAPAMAQRGPQGPIGRDAYMAIQKDRFAEMDANKDGVVSREEMSDRIAERMGNDPPDRMVDRMFARLDADGDGKATAAEAEAGAAARFADLDSDHDGVLTEEERRAGMERMRMQMRSGKDDQASPPAR